MKSLNELLNERDELRKEDRRLSDEITAARVRDQWEKKMLLDSPEKYRQYKDKAIKLTKENVELRRLVALLMRDGSNSYKAIGSKIGVSSATVRGYVDNQTRKLRLQDRVDSQYLYTLSQSI